MTGPVGFVNPAPRRQHEAPHRRPTPPARGAARRAVSARRRRRLPPRCLPPRRRRRPSFFSMDRSTPASRAISGGRRPPRPTTAPPEKTRRRPFVAPHPRPTANPLAAGLPRRQDLPSPTGGLPCQLPNDVLVPPRGRQMSTFTEPQGASPPFSTAATFDARSTASSPVLMYEAVDDDFSSTPIVDWTPDFSANVRGNIQESAQCKISHQVTHNPSSTL